MWVVNAEGVYIENRPYHSYLEDDILTAINEKYGTNFSSLTYLREPSISIGDDCPDWNAYEKIEMPGQKIAAKVGQTEYGNIFMIGKLSGENFEVITNGLQSCLVRSNGIIDNFTGPPASETNTIKQLLQNVGITATSITEKVVSWQEGTEVPNWSEYTQYS